MSNTNTINNFKNIFGNFATRHNMNNGYGFGPIYLINNFSNSGQIYPIYWVDHVGTKVIPGATNQYKETQYTFDIYSLDQVMSGDINLNDVLSDRNTLLQEMVQEFVQDPYYNTINFKVRNVGNAQRILNFANGHLSGYKIRLDITSPNRYTPCNTPITPIFSFTASLNGNSVVYSINGSSGTSGTSGTSGISGTSGTSGTSGATGPAGTSGTAGSSGATGATGPSGTSGTSGSSGTSGTSGTSGISGITGATGFNNALQQLTFAQPTITWNTSLGQNAYVLLTGNATLSISNMTIGSFYNLIVTQDATGSRTLIPPSPSAIVGAGGGFTGSALALSVTGTASDMVNFFYTGFTQSNSGSGTTASWLINYGLNYT